MGKRILYQILDNPLDKNHGNKTWSLQILKYFKNRGFDVDFVSDRQWGMWDEDDISDFTNLGLAKNVFILNRKPSKDNIFSYFLNYKLPEFVFKKKFGFYKPVIPDLITRYYQNQFNEILKENQYDYIYVNYTTCANLIKENPFLKSAATIIDTHDFFTAQYQQQKNFDIARAFKEEIKVLSYFDNIWTVSIEEQYVFSQFCGNRKISLVQTMLDKPKPTALIPFEKKSYDLIYVASDISHNKKAAEWFFTKVYPMLSSDLRICTIGKITNYIPDLPNVKKILFADDLSGYYANSKICICPMLSGTGIKVKVVEALSFNLPVVCSPRGVDGLLNKTDNGCIIASDDIEFAGSITKLLTDRTLYEEQSRMAAHTFDTFFEKEKAYERLDKFFEIV